MNEPPVLKTPDRICPNCGNPIPAGWAHCSVCGHGLPPVRAKSKTNTILLVILTTVIGIPSAMCGGCFLMIGGTSDVASTLFGLVGLAIFAALFWATIVAWRKR